MSLGVRSPDVKAGASHIAPNARIGAAVGCSSTTSVVESALVLRRLLSLAGALELVTTSDHSRASESTLSTAMEKRAPSPSVASVVSADAARTAMAALYVPLFDIDAGLRALWPAVGATIAVESAPRVLESLVCASSVWVVGGRGGGAVFVGILCILF